MLKSIGGLVGAAVIAATLGFAAPALAVTTFNFSGQIESSSLPSGGFFPDLTGTNFTGTFSYDEAALDGAPSSPQGVYNSVGASYGATVSGGGYTVPITGGIVQNVVAPGPSIDQYTMYAKNNVAIQGFGTLGFALTIILTDLTGNALGSDALGLPSLVDYALSWFQFEVKDLTTNKTAIYN
ncbi:MAG: hypothetical protein EOO81_08155, partial [Oxalobacteraceae bacterium]